MLGAINMESRGNLLNGILPKQAGRQSVNTCLLPAGLHSNLSLLGCAHHHRADLSKTEMLKFERSEDHMGASLVAQWLRICLPMQGTRVRALVWEDPACRGATRPVSHNY